jgi:hypothetical protein
MTLLRATPPIRRLISQAIFEVIWVWEEDHIRAELASRFKELAAISQATVVAETSATADLSAWELTATVENDQAPTPGRCRKTWTLVRLAK